MKYLIVISFILIANVYPSSEIKCVFTNPYLQVVVDLENNTMKKGSLVNAETEALPVSDQDIQYSEPVKIRVINYEMEGFGVFLKDQSYSYEHSLIEISKRIGRDEKSDYIYPLSGIIRSDNNKRGGCSVESFKEFKSMDAYSYLKNLVPKW